MKYLLLVEFLCEIYRREPKARIFLNEQLLDEFSIQQNTAVDPWSLDKQMQVIPDYNNKIMAETKNLKQLGFNNFKIYQFDMPREPDHLTLKIDIENNDNNYTNGFMTRYTLIQLKHLFLIPLNEKLISMLRQRKIRKQFTKHYAWWRSEKHNISNLFSHTRWRDDKGEIEMTYGQKLGTSGSFTCELVKKYNMLIPRDMSPTWIYNVDPMVLVWYFLDKYKPDENK